MYYNYDIDKLNSLPRWKIEKILTEHGFQCYEREYTEELREALKVNIRDGTINRSVLWDD